MLSNDKRSESMQSSTTMQKRSAEIQDSPLVSWWIKVTSPSPGSTASYRNSQWREEVISLLIPITILLALVGILTSFNDPVRVLILSLAVCCNTMALFFKRSGMTRLTGTIIIITVELSLFAFVLTAGGGHPSIEDVPLMDHLLESVLVAMAFFTPVTGLIVAVLNCIFMFLVFKFYPHGEEFLHHLKENFWSIVLPPLILHMVVAGVFFIIMRALMKEIRRADNAEEIAQLRQSELELREQEMQRSQQLEVGTQVILQTLNTTATNADFSMRVPLAQDNLLWCIAYSINNLLARLQRLRDERKELDKTRTVVNQLRECMKQRQYYPLQQWTGTMIDPLIMEFNNHLHMLEKPSDQLPPSGNPIGIMNSVHLVDAKPSDQLPPSKTSQSGGQMFH
jgi:hypothetical protein